MSYYTEVPETRKVGVLGTEYGIWLDVPEDCDPLLKDCAGYCDKTTKRIVVMAEPSDSELGDWSVYSKACLRHELIHAFFHESGFDGNSHYIIEGEEHPEAVVEWIALQFPKMLKVFTEAEAL